MHVRDAGCTSTGRSGVAAQRPSRMIGLMPDTDERQERPSPWYQLPLLIVLLLVLAVALGGRVPAGRDAGVFSAIATMGGRLADLAGGILGSGRRGVGCRMPSVGSNLRQIALGMICYSSEADGAWPLDFTQLQAWSDGELVPKLFRDPRWPAEPDPFVYVRPTAQAKPDQPVLLTRPTTGSKPAVVICYADGHIGTVAGTAVWEEARRLAWLPKAMAEGIAPGDWTTVPALRSKASGP